MHGPRITLLWYAPTSPDPDTYIATVMRRTRDLRPPEEIEGSLAGRGSYCVQCGAKFDPKFGHDPDKGDPSTHRILPVWVVNLVRGAKKWGHYDVFEHVVYSFSLENVSRVLSHQLVRHRIASYSQISARLVATKGQVVPPLDYLRDQTQREKVRAEIDEEFDRQWRLYDSLRARGVRAEDARYVVGDGQTTSLIMTVNARSLAHILRMRLDPEAQWEIRDVADRMRTLVAPTAPVLWEDPLPEGI